MHNQGSTVVAKRIVGAVFVRDKTNSTRFYSLFSHKAPNPPASKQKVVVLGTGWGSFRFAKDIDKDYYDVTVISPRNHFLFTPLLPSTAVGTLEFRSIVEPIRSVQGISFFQAQAEQVDTANKVIKCTSVFDPAHFEFSYDKLVIGVGAHNQTFGISGVGTNCFFLKELHEARAVRSHIIDCLEQASEPDAIVPLEEKKNLLHFVIVGGGPTGVEFAAELHDFLVQDLQKAYPKLYPLLQITVVEAGNNILSSFDAKLSHYAATRLKQQNVRLMTTTRVKEVLPRKLVLADGTEIPFGLCVWSTGVAPRPFTKKLDPAIFPKDKQGHILVDHFMRVQGQNDIYAIGDCCNIFDLPLASTAQVANQQGKYVARSFNNTMMGKEVKPFTYVHKGMLAYVGGYTALADLKEIKGTGFLSWVFWRSAYATTLVSWRNKMLVPMTWLKTFLFGRDISKF